MIQDGVYPPGSQLPSEPELALQMDVSRMTLRRLWLCCRRTIWSSTYAVRETSSANAIPAPVCRAWRSHSTRSAVLCPDPLTRQRWNFA